MADGVEEGKSRGFAQERRQSLGQLKPVLVGAKNGRHRISGSGST